MHECYAANPKKEEKTKITKENGHKEQSDEAQGHVRKTQLD